MLYWYPLLKVSGQSEAEQRHLATTSYLQLISNKVGQPFSYPISYPTLLCVYLRIYGDELIRASHS